MQPCRPGAVAPEPPRGGLGLGSGAAYVFKRYGDAWAQHAYIKATNTDAGDGYGWGLTYRDGRLAVGAHREDSSATGLDGNQADDSAADAGAVYTDLIDSVWTDEGSSLAGDAGIPSLLPRGQMLPDTDLRLDLVKAAPSSLTALLLAPSSTPAPFKGGTIKPFPFFDPLVFTTDLAGELVLAFPWPAGIPSGSELWIQYLIQDVTGPQGFTLSNALRGVTP